MRVTINPVLDLETLTWSGESFDYNGPVAVCGGSSAEAKANEAAQTAFYQQVTQQQSTAFSQQQDILNSIKAITLPILNKGPNQYGFTPEEDALLRGEITTQSATAESNAANAAALRAKQLSGGANVLPTGAQEEIAADINVLGEQEKAKQLSAERLAGWQAGEQKYTGALAALSGNAGMLNPTSYASAATGAGESATGAIKVADSERSNLLSSVLGGVIGAGASFLTGGLSNIAGGGGFLSPATGGG